MSAEGILRPGSEAYNKEIATLNLKAEAR